VGGLGSRWGMKAARPVPQCHSSCVHRGVGYSGRIQRIATPASKSGEAEAIPSRTLGKVVLQAAFSRPVEPRLVIQVVDVVWLPLRGRIVQLAIAFVKSADVPNSVLENLARPVGVGQGEASEEGRREGREVFSGSPLPPFTEGWETSPSDFGGQLMTTVG